MKNELCKEHSSCGGCFCITIRQYLSYYLILIILEKVLNCNYKQELVLT